MKDLDVGRRCVRMVAVRREGRALLESTPSARRDAEAWAGVSAWRLPPLCHVPCLGFKAENSGGLGAEPPGNPRGEKPCTRAAPQPAVGHMSTYRHLPTRPVGAGRLGTCPCLPGKRQLGRQVPSLPAQAGKVGRWPISSSGGKKVLSGLHGPSFPRRNALGLPRIPLPRTGCWFA